MKAERVIRKKFTLAFGAAETDKSAALAVEGVVQYAYVNVANWTNSPTANLYLSDVEDLKYYKSANLNKNTENQLNPNAGVVGDGKVGVVLSGVPGGSGGNVVVVLIIKTVGA